MTAQELLERVAQTPTLPTAPAVAAALLRAAPDASVASLREILRLDPALTGKLLKMVNAPTYGLASQVDTLPQAADLVGLHSMRMLALSFTLKPETQAASLQLDAVWHRSVARGAIAETLARSWHPDLVEQAYACGVLAEIGWIALAQQHPELISETLTNAEKNNESLAAAQAETIGCTQAELSAAVLQAWDVPRAIVTAVETQLDPPLADAPLVALLKAANAWMGGAWSRAAACLACEQDELMEQHEAIQAAADDATSRLEPANGTPGIGQLQADAALQLAMLSMQSEAERFQLNRNEQAALEESERLNQENKRILEAASTDGLTQIPNRASFDQRLDEELQRAQEQHERIALLLLDVDHFKQFNDTYGHRAGDEVLRRVAAALQHAAPGFVARYGGEEFAVILAQNAAERADEVGEQLRAAIEDCDVPWNNEVLRVTASFGVAVLDNGAIPAKDLIEQSDQQLYAAKRAGRNRVMLVQLDAAQARA